MITDLSLDLDGTLVDWRHFRGSSVFVVRMIQALTKEVGRRKAIESFMVLGRVLTAKSVPPSLTHLTNSGRAAAALAASLEISPHEAAQLIEGLLKKVFPTLREYFFPVPGARDFVHWAKDHYGLILATNPVWPTEIIQLRIEWAGLDPGLFRFITDSNSMHYCKPEANYFREVLKLQNLNASQVLHVGNEIQMDLPASEAGIRVFILDRNRILKKMIPSAPSHASAWKGTFSVLKTLLVNQTL